MKLLNMAVILSVLLTMILGVSACAPATYRADNLSSDTSLALLPNWYHPKIGYRLMGANAYPENGTLATLLKDADNAFNLQNLQACQIYLERAQRISARAPGVYVRLSYLFWLLDEPAQAEQMARRALAVMSNDVQARSEVKRLLISIQSARY